MKLGRFAIHPGVLDAEEQVQKLTDESIIKVDTLMKRKESEIMTV